VRNPHPLLLPPRFPLSRFCQGGYNFVGLFSEIISSDTYHQEPSERCSAAMGNVERRFVLRFAQAPPTSLASSFNSVNFSDIQYNSVTLFFWEHSRSHDKRAHANLQMLFFHRT
jgi:hypothetical protein